MVSLLLQNGAHVDRQDILGYTPLMWIADRNRRITIASCIDGYCPVDLENRIIITGWKRDTDVRIASILLKHKAQVDMQDKWHNFVLHIAAFWLETPFINQVIRHLTAKETTAAKMAMFMLHRRNDTHVARLPKPILFEIVFGVPLKNTFWNLLTSRNAEDKTILNILEARKINHPALEALKARIRALYKYSITKGC
jgi:hypothetical protein